jgi:uncharacterized protein YjiS (DUF1127 family)
MRRDEGPGVKDAMAGSRARQVDHRDNLHKLGRSHRYTAEHGKHLFSASDLLERLMPPSFESPRGVMIPHDVQNCELTSELCDKGSVEENPNANLSPRAISPIDRAIAALLASFAEGFALFAAAYFHPSEAKPEQPEKISVPKGSRSLALVSSTHPEVTRSAPERSTDRPHTGFPPSADVRLAEIHDSPSFDADHPTWLAWSWSIALDRWQHWRHEREIRKVVATLEELDDRTLRDIGIPDRSQIEQAARYGRKWELD